MDIDRETLLVILLVAALSPVVADLPARVRVPGVVVEIMLGIVVGPHVLGLATPDDLVEVLSEFGLAFLFFFAGMEIDFDRMRGRPLTLAARGWGISLVLGMAAAALLWAAGVIGAPVLVGLTLTTTALGALVPILRDAGLAESKLGGHVLTAGAVGEFAPIVALSIVLAIASGKLWHTLLLLVFAAATVLIGVIAVRARPTRVVRLVEATMHASGQLAVRLAILLLGGLFVLAGTLGLDVVLGAFSAGMIVGLIARGETAHTFHAKLDGVGYGFLIPIFFITTGLNFDLDALLSSAASIALVPGFAALFLLSRGLPALLLYRSELIARQRVALALMTSAGLPLIVAITDIAVEGGRLDEQDAVALVGAGMLSLLAFPLIATSLSKTGP